jgi:hypothetical protein
VTSKLQIGGGAQFTDQRVSTTTPRWTPGYLLYDAMVAYQVNQHVGLRFNIYHLTDENYIDRVGGGHLQRHAQGLALRSHARPARWRPRRRCRGRHAPFQSAVRARAAPALAHRKRPQTFRKPPEARLTPFA